MSGLGTPALGSGVWAVLLGMSPELTGVALTLVPELHSNDVRKRADVPGFLHLTAASYFPVGSALSPWPPSCRKGKGPGVGDLGARQDQGGAGAHQYSLECSTRV